MHRVAESIHVCEKYDFGLDSYLCNLHTSNRDAFDCVLDADIHVTHTHFPDFFRRKLNRLGKRYKLVYVAHGTPEHVFEGSVTAGLHEGYGHGDSWMLMQYFLQHADLRVTFWPRHQVILQSLCDKGTKVHCVPLGIDRNQFGPQNVKRVLSGEPALLTAENSHRIKWPLDLFIAWPWVYDAVDGDPVLHVLQMPTDKHRWFFPLVNRNGASYGSHISPISYRTEELVVRLNACDFYLNLVQKGDFNKIGLEAAACGKPVISYTGNPYAAYWVPEGDQRVLAGALIDILNGVTAPRKPDPVPDIKDTVSALIKLYESC
jgi:glycosyltransferase involved in cell wall biosynthesis